MARNRRYRRRGPRVYVRAHVGCLGCSVPLLALLAAVVAAAALVLS